jgi:hypothetical protein
VSSNPAVGPGGGTVGGGSAGEGITGLVLVEDGPPGAGKEATTATNPAGIAGHSR